MTSSIPELCFLLPSSGLVIFSLPAPLSCPAGCSVVVGSCCHLLLQIGPLLDPVEVVAFVSALLVLLLHIQDALQQAVGFPVLNMQEYEALETIHECHDMLQALNASATASLHCFWLRSTAWFTRFVIEQYVDDRWVQHFRMTKSVVFKLADMLSPHIRRRNTPYRLAIPIVVRLSCTLFKLAQGASLTICSELFAVGTSTTSSIVHDTICAINIVLRDQIAWPCGAQLQQTQVDFRELCSSGCN
jgi:hypothetical protein